MTPRRITRSAFYRNGGFSSTSQFRYMRSGIWRYYTY